MTRPSFRRLSAASSSAGSPPPETDVSWDVVILGGSLAGASAAVLLLRQQPDLRVLILERAPVFRRRVGEATVEISGYFLGRVLGLTRHLNEHHLVKQGMRFWFQNGRTSNLADSSEIGGRYLVRLPAYQVDRAVLDEKVLELAVSAGATVWRPASAARVDLRPGGLQSVTVRREDVALEVRARWVVDASGVGAVLARQEGWLEPNTRHPTSSAWARWEGVADWDGRELAERHPEWAAACPGIRGTATNHFMGDGWWAWCIPLKDGDVSVGVVFDERRVHWPETGSVGERLKAFLDRHPAAREILARARWKEGDVHWRRHLAYRSRVIAGDGFVVVGDAAGFIDPFYSPGMDWLAFTTFSGVDIVRRGLGGEELAPVLARHNATFGRSYDRWFEAVYENKYAYLGDFELMRLAFVLDLGLYYLGIVSQPFKRGDAALLQPVFSTGPSVPVFHLMRAYNRRLAAIAESRRARGAFGRRNDRERFLFGGFSLDPMSARPVISALGRWLLLELTEGWRSWGRRRSGPVAAQPIPVAGAGKAPGVNPAPGPASASNPGPAAGKTRGLAA
ncbi:MAG: NAD(P)/FAD-dependent oxidoreductase [Limisphaerales bacterium]